MATTPNVPLRYMDSAEADKSVTYNDNLALQAAFTAQRALSRSETDPPPSPLDGDVYLLPVSGCTGVWAGQDGKIAIQSGGLWLFVDPVPGLLWLVLDEDVRSFWDEATLAWSQYNAGGISRLEDDPTPRAGGPLDGGGNTVKGFRPNRRRITNASYTWNPASDLGVDLVCTAPDGCAITLPGSGVALDQIGYFTQLGAILRFQGDGQSQIIHPQQHDRGQGPISGLVAMVQDLGPPVTWSLWGMTTAAVNDGLARVAGWAVGSQDVTSPASSTGWFDAQTYMHTPQDNESWVYIGTSFVEASRANDVNPARVRMASGGGAAPSELTRLGRGRYAPHREMVQMLVGRQYGADPGPQTFRLQGQSGSSSDTITLGLPSIYALRLEADEQLAVQAAEQSTPGSSYVTAVSLTANLPADDYAVLAYAAWSVDTTGAVWMALDVNGTLYHEREMFRRNTALRGSFSVVKALTGLSGPTTFAVRLKSGTLSPTVRANDGVIVLLRKSRFKAWFAAQAADPSPNNPTSSTAFSTRTSLDAALVPNWQHLALFSADSWMSSEVSIAWVNGLFRRNRASLLKQAQAGTEMTTGSGFWTPHGLAGAALVAPVQPTDTFDIQFDIQSSSYQAKLKEAQILILPLKAV